MTERLIRPTREGPHMTRSDRLTFALLLLGILAAQLVTIVVLVRGFRGQL